uniref:t-SNARE coiled-coil homology domain-containing protein n=1 Tax=Aegilops tauschii subsp. strangulata TaxID=200361 RepID=A0A453QGG0_AEGTS
MSATSSSFFGSNGKKKPAARNPFDSDSDDDGGMVQQRPPARASSVPTPAVEADQRGALFAGAAAAGPGPSGFASSSSAAAARGRYRNDFRDSGGVEAQSVQELEGYAAYKAEETTRRVDGCLRVAEEMRDTASKTLLQVHQQGQQIRRTHAMALDIDQDLSRVTRRTIHPLTSYSYLPNLPIELLPTLLLLLTGEY